MSFTLTNLILLILRNLLIFCLCIHVYIREYSRRLRVDVIYIYGAKCSSSYYCNVKQQTFFVVNKGLELNT